MPPEQAMPSAQLEALNPPRSGPPAAKEVRSGGLKVKGKLKQALDLLVYGGPDGEAYDWTQAATKAGMTVRNMRKALERPHVQRYLREQKQVFRSSVAASNILVAREIRDKGRNDAARMKAIDYLEGESTQQQQSSAGKTVVPGVVVHIAVSQAPPAVAMGEIIEVNPAADMAQSQGTTDT